MCPSYITEIWKIDMANKPPMIPKGNLRIPVTRIINKIITPILSADIIDIERVYPEKITPFQDYWLNLIELTHKTHNWKQKPLINLAFYDHTIAMINSNPIFAKDEASIIDSVKILKDYEVTIHSIIAKRLTLLQDALNEIDVNDLLTSLYGSFMALVCFWIIARKSQSGKAISEIAKISHKLAINLDSYTDTLDIMTNPEEMDLMKRAEHWERHNLQNRAR